MRHMLLAAGILAFGTVTGDHLSALDGSRADVDAPLPAPWTYQDIGNVGPADIWGSAGSPPARARLELSRRLASQNGTVVHLTCGHER
jgi:hypothetical protein